MTMWSYYEISGDVKFEKNKKIFGSDFDFYSQIFHCLLIGSYSLRILEVSLYTHTKRFFEIHC